MQDFNSTMLSLQQDVNQLHASDTARNIWSGPAAALTFGGLLLNTYLFCRQRPQLDAKKQQDERDMDLVLDTLGIEKNKPIEPIYPYEKILACCSSKYKNIVNDKIANNSIKPAKQDIKALIKLKLQEIENDNINPIEIIDTERQQTKAPMPRKIGISRTKSAKMRNFTKKDKKITILTT